MTAQSKSRTQSSANTKATAALREKVEHPAQEFENPGEVVADPELSKGDKMRALDALEQDARQLAVATAEGMSGGEETELRSVLQAKRSLESTSVDSAFAVVTRTFEEQLDETRGMELHGLLLQAIEAIKAAREGLASRQNQPKVPPGAPQPGSASEMQEEIEKEKLDPGA